MKNLKLIFWIVRKLVYIFREGFKKKYNKLELLAAAPLTPTPANLGPGLWFGPLAGLSFSQFMSNE